MSANEKQVGGEHYKQGYQHWDMVADGYLDYFKGQATKYLTRYRRKNGIQDLEKSIHYLEKMAELLDTRGRQITPATGVTTIALMRFLEAWGAEYDHLDRAAMTAVVLANEASLRLAIEMVVQLRMRAQRNDGSEPSAGYVAQ